MTRTNRQFRLAKRPSGRPDRDAFELVETDVPDSGPGEVVVRTRYLSVDPYMRDRMDASESYAEPWDVGDPLRGAAVGVVVASEHDEFSEGDVVTGNLAWADYAAADGDDLTHVRTGDAPVSTALGVLGMPGRTAYFGMLDVIDPTPGDTVVVSGAAGAVGSVAGQLATLGGCRVVGIAGSDEKTTYLTDELGFDAAMNYADTDDYASALADAAPDGVDAYYDNVGGEITDAVFESLNERASVGVCGQISLYNAEETPVGPRKLQTVLTKRATVEGFLVGDFASRFEEATRRLGSWVESGDLRYRETVTEGLENAPDAFLGLFDGENVGKQLVTVSDEGEDDAADEGT